jgi:hypothetical protein
LIFSNLECKPMCSAMVFQWFGQAHQEIIKITSDRLTLGTGSKMVHKELQFHGEHDEKARLGDTPVVIPIRYTRSMSIEYEGTIERKSSSYMFIWQCVKTLYPWWTSK